MTDYTNPSCPEHGGPVHCNRCEKLLDSARELAGTITVVMLSPIMANPSPGIVLCAECGLEHAQWLMPGLADDPEFQFANAIVGGLSP